MISSRWQASSRKPSEGGELTKVTPVWPRPVSDGFTSRLVDLAVLSLLASCVDAKRIRACAVSACVGMLVMSPPHTFAQSQAAGVDKLMFHNNAQRTGWNDRETTLTPAVV